MWNNKKIKVLDNYNIGGTKKGDVITVKGDYGCNSGQILTINNESYKNAFNDWHFPPNDGKYWEIIEEIIPNKIVPKRPSKSDYITVEGLGYMSGYTMITRYDEEYEGKFDETRCSGPSISDFNNEKSGKFVFNINSGTCFGPTSDRKWRFSTPEERQWLDACITKNAFVTKEEALTVKSKYEVGKWYKMEMWNSIGVRCSKVDTKIHYDAFISPTGELNAQIGTYDFANNLEEVDKTIIDKYLKPATTMYKFEIGQEVNPVKDKGNYFCSPESFYKLSTETQKEYQGSGSVSPLSKIKERTVCNNTNWYLVEDYGNWVSEEALEATFPTTTTTAMKYPHPIGTKVLYQEKEHVIEAYYAASSTDNPSALISGPMGCHNGGKSILENEFGNTIHSDGKNNKYFVPVKELSLVKETLPFYKFKVGDRVIGNSKANNYAYTIEGVTGVVTKLFENKFEMKIDAGFKNAGKEYEVVYDKFDLYQLDKYPATPKESYLISPFDTGAIYSRISEIKQEEGNVSIGKVKRMLIPVKTI